MSVAIEFVRELKPRQCMRASQASLDCGRDSLSSQSPTTSSISKLAAPLSRQVIVPESEVGHAPEFTFDAVSTAKKSYVPGETQGAAHAENTMTATIRHIVSSVAVDLRRRS